MVKNMKDKKSLLSPGGKSGGHDLPVRGTER